MDELRGSGGVPRLDSATEEELARAAARQKQVQAAQQKEVEAAAARQREEEERLREERKAEVAGASKELEEALEAVQRQRTQVQVEHERERAAQSLADARKGGMVPLRSALEEAKAKRVEPEIISRGESWLRELAAKSLTEAMKGEDVEALRAALHTAKWAAVEKAVCEDGVARLRRLLKEEMEKRERARRRLSDAMEGRLSSGCVLSWRRLSDAVKRLRARLDKARARGVQTSLISRGEALLRSSRQAMATKIETKLLQDLCAFLDSSGGSARSSQLLVQFCRHGSLKKLHLLKRWLGVTAPLGRELKKSHVFEELLRRVLILTPEEAPLSSEFFLVFAFR
ncbi:hypothetical protein EMIHUDRAFT_109793 [Emiliania huxleyi CCMP1516]|uniref:Uncharacterized protein n=2 Tax=Emiliania huxleyi TaxID=2903 RepID=A0A0D3KP72_EMIH1|nr:hypothetical protein EMIHUDRAFT_109793 [Emiliania huxleyi CCMP1516]EOD37557.1 hypothetical protein EMIHUDRAFT_109793 [Emiliania huxleyi CCMP1516]|eukprot:XP_005789986.1 hypothetical protein EMIHUDRAFT_109793 [Emiliania huxleyi CCMP1516]